MSDRIDIVSKTVACWECSGRGIVTVQGIREFGSADSIELGLRTHSVHISTQSCPECNATGMVTIRANFNDIPVIDRTGQ